MGEALSLRYATALVDLLFQPNSPIDPERAIAELGAFEAAMTQASDLKHILFSPAVSRLKKRQVIESLASQMQLSDTIRNFLYVAIDRNRAGLIKGAKDMVRRLADERQGIARPAVTSALPMGDEEKQAVEAQLSRITGKAVRCDYAVDPALLGGVIARIGSTVYDGSVRGQLATLKSRLTE